MICVYCGKSATTRDHVPPRCLLEKPYPASLRTVPCCVQCNSAFSLDEQYFLILLGQIGTSATLAAKVEPGAVIDRALTRRPALDERIMNSLERTEDGRIIVRPETERVNRVIQKIALGLFIHRYRKYPVWDVVSDVAAYPYNTEDQRPLPVFTSLFTERLRAKRWKHIQRGVFSYIVVRDPMNGSEHWLVMDFHQTLWGVAHLPNPNSVPVRENRQLSLLDPNTV